MKHTAISHTNTIESLFTITFHYVSKWSKNCTELVHPLVLKWYRLGVTKHRTGPQNRYILSIETRLVFVAQSVNSCDASTSSIVSNGASKS